MMKTSLFVFLSVCAVFSACNSETGPVRTALSENTELTGEMSEGTGLVGLTGLNDASRIIKSGDKYFWYSTGGGIKMRWTASPQSGVWNSGPDVFPTRPAFWADYSPINIAWAPDIVYHVISGEYRMYYCVSSLGSTKSAIGLATNTTLDPADPDYEWVDKGIVISTEEGDPYNALDPCPVRTPENAWFLCFGSHFGGIKLIRLGPDGKRHPTLTNMWSLARKEPKANSAIEAAAIYPGTKNGTAGFWLFVNWGTGLGHEENATYEVRMGWSTDIRGPYADKNGMNMYNGGGTVFMPNKQTFIWDNSTRIGRGHIGIIKGEMLDGTHPDWVSYSYWLENPPSGEDGKRFGLQRLKADTDGWPDDRILFQN
ncbi:arabinan endo-1,5-alpha-L-arabinosidase [Sinomicrobium weinanense]|uniref:Arabinan endo-1,5-alpha-L-arabinosidase n=1 Tax=Sinomicrobium weinanense TaxID=2842200 RepID=A0A926JSA6_9FLAO|nr:arabinan endo-1,5-alpha-L-arabinosidase [Sinomicrobium weinanense]MBC9796471.1 arabinan endo-1,5-alpha-L-arabinosidase [Sinomicrobium weinanense]MBU3125932.1 arabinan endo-1,5-alpha-L-arabinosidase [Sinomicrobium weinanense]